MTASSTGVEQKILIYILQVTSLAGIRASQMTVLASHYSHIPPAALYALAKKAGYIQEIYYKEV